MTDDLKKLSFTDLIDAPDMQFVEVKTPRGIVTLGTVSSADIIDWFEENDDPVKRKYSGLRLLVKSIVNPDGSRVGAGAADKADLDRQREAAVIALARRDSSENGLLVKEALFLNGLRDRPKDEPGPNASSEAKSDASPIASGSQSVN